MATTSTQADSTATPAQFKAETIQEWYPLKDDLFFLEGKELAFMKAQTGIEDEEELKQHIISVTREAYAVFPFPCIRRFNHLKFKFPGLPGYDQVLKLGREREGAILLDIGCCFGNDIRTAVADGFPATQLIATDLYGEYWALGHKLFRSTPASFPASFIAGNAFNPEHLAITPPLYESTSEPTPDLSALTSLNPLHGHVSVIHASSFFHLFDEEKQAHIAQALAGLLSPLPGSIILGSHAGGHAKGSQVHKVGPNKDNGSFTFFFHSPESWTELWDGQVFKKGTVKVETRLIEYTAGPDGEMVYFLQWCVTRI